MPNEKKLTPQERATNFQEEYVKLCAKWKCQHAYAPAITAEGRIVVQAQVQINDE